MRAIALLAFALLAAAVSCAAENPKAPLLVLLSGDSKTWQTLCLQRGWQFILPWGELQEKSIDQRVKALAAKVEQVAAGPQADVRRVYLAAQGDPALFYIVSRIPDLWAAAVSVGGSPRAAIDSNRVFAANTTNVPVLWLMASGDDQPLAEKLKSAGFNLESKKAEGVTTAEVFDWLAMRQRDEFPTTADCETGTPLFPRCYWVEMTRFDPGERNDVLDSSRVKPLGSGARLAIGPFAYDLKDAGPGAEVVSLPDKYDGPLKPHDRIVEVGGKEVRDAAQYAALMYQIFEEKPVVVMVARGKQRLRLETRVVLPPREEAVTARVRASYLPAMQEVEVISREVTQMKLTLPEAWLPLRISWNGTEVASAETAGCWLLTEAKELLTARRCPQ